MNCITCKKTEGTEYFTVNAVFLGMCKPCVSRYRVEELSREIENLTSEISHLCADGVGEEVVGTKIDKYFFPIVILRTTIHASHPNR